MSTSRVFAGRELPLLFAHRGASWHAPENTLEAFELGVKLGADVLECDVHLSQDGEVVVIHDATLERTTNGRGRVCEHSYAELALLDAGYHFHAPSGEQLFRGRGARISRLADVLAAFPQAAFNIELKQRTPSMVGATLEVLQKLGPGRVLLAAGDDVIMRELEAAKPGCPLGLSAAQVAKLLGDVYLGRAPTWSEPRALQIPPRRGFLPVATRWVIDAAHRAGLEVHLWTINSAEAAQRWLARGVDGVMSDDPAALTALMFGLRAARG